MATCPQCQAALKDEYGMVQCPSCSAFLFIDMEGNAFMGTKSETVKQPMPGESAPASEAAWDSGQPVVDEPLVSYDDPQGTEPIGASESPAGFEASEDASSPVDLGAPAPEHEPEDFAPIDLNPEPEAASDRDGMEAESRDLGPADDPLGLAKFAKSEISQANDGPLVFRVFISGIDTKELRDSLREVLEDSRFVWDANAILGKLSKGKLTIENLSPVKAMILVNQIKRLPVKIHWEQNAISQIDP